MRLHRYIACLLFTAASTHAAQVVAFGDSLSDGGFFFGIRFTDPGGDLWHEQLADTLGYDRAITVESIFGGSGLNLAVGGSLVDDLQGQVDRYSGRYDWQTGDLCTLWIGGNDLRDAPNQDVRLLTDEIGRIIEQLAALGIDHFLVPNLPDLGAIPEVSNSTEATARRAGTIAFNQALALELEARANTHGVRIDLLDIFNLFEQMLFYSGDYGFLNVSEPLNGASGAAPETYAFWDGIHPTARSHSLIASSALAVVEPEAPIEVVTWSINLDGDLRQTWLADPAATYKLHSGTELDSLLETANFQGSPAYTISAPAPGTERGFYQLKKE